MRSYNGGIEHRAAEREGPNDGCVLFQEEKSSGFLPTFTCPLSITETIKKWYALSGSCKYIHLGNTLLSSYAQRPTNDAKLLSMATIITLQ